MMSLGVAFVCVAACTSPRRDGSGGDDANTGSGMPDGNGGGSGSGDMVSIYAHTSNTLYRVDPDTLAITKVGDFSFGLADQMTDIAIDKTGLMVGVSFTAVYRVDTTNAHTTQLSNNLADTFNGLSFVPAASVGLTGDDVLIGTRTGDGKVFKVDPMTGATTQAGDMGAAFSSSGDLVAVAGFGMVQTVKDGSAHDRLARLAPNTFSATAIGTDTGFDDIWGVGFWKGTIYGFTDGGQFIKIDPSTGVATLVAGNGPAWWGAAVTTTAPVIF
jgi:hypothetical protein